MYICVQEHRHKLHETKIKRRKRPLLFKKISEGAENQRGNNMAINDQNPMAKSTLQRNKGNYVHSCIPKLKPYHSQIRLHSIERFTQIP